MRELTKELLILATWLLALVLGAALFFTSDDDVAAMLGLVLGVAGFVLTISQLNYLKGFR